MKSLLCIVFSMTLMIAGAVTAQEKDRADLEGTTITGNRELPKILYIVPWKKTEVGDLIGRPVSSLLDEVLAPVDRDVFQRQVEFHGMLEMPSQAGGGKVKRD